MLFSVIRKSPDLPFTETYQKSSYLASEETYSVSKGIFSIREISFSSVSGGFSVVCRRLVAVVPCGRSRFRLSVFFRLRRYNVGAYCRSFLRDDGSGLSAPRFRFGLYDVPARRKARRNCASAEQKAYFRPFFPLI